MTTTSRPASGHPHRARFGRRAPLPVVPRSAPPWGTASELRAWQAEALEQYFARGRRRRPRDFLAAATPGAGKTTFALRLASRAAAPARHRPHHRRRARPSTSRRQWADAAARVGIRLDPAFSNAPRPQRPALPRRRRHLRAGRGEGPAAPRAHRSSGRTLVILDEVHHGGDALSWGDAIREAFGPRDAAAARSPGTPVPQRHRADPVRASTQPDEHGIRLSQHRLRLRLRPRARRRRRAPGDLPGLRRARCAGARRTGDEMEAQLGAGQHEGHHRAGLAHRARPDGGVDPGGAALGRPPAHRGAAAVPDAGGLVIATDQTAARAYAADPRGASRGEPRHRRALRREGGDRRASRSSRASTRRWMVAVRMVSEGVDVPRLAVGVYATSASTPLFFAQAITSSTRWPRRPRIVRAW